jgi:hypothetical protein
MCRIRPSGRNSLSTIVRGFTISINVKFSTLKGVALKECRGGFFIRACNRNWHCFEAVIVRFKNSFFVLRVDRMYSHLLDNSPA